MNIKLNMFHGSRPQAAIHLLGPGEGQTAENCKLDKGDLRPWKQYAPVKPVADLGTPRTLYLYQDGDDDHWIASDTEYDFARSPVAGDAHNRLYYTGGTEARVVASDLISDPFDLSTDSYKLGVPAPVAAPTVDSGYTTGNAYRAYVYSYVVRLGGEDLEEGPPSDFDSIEDYGSGNVTLSRLEEPPSGRQIGKIRVYRTNAATAGVSAFQFVGSFLTSGFDFTSGTFTDDVAEDDLGTDGPRPETWVPPPAGMLGLIALVNGSMAGFKGNVVYISAPFSPHAWPYEYSVDATIVGLGWYGTTCVVLTDSHVYFLEGRPEAFETPKSSGVYPCVSKRGIISDVGRGGGVIFPSEEGWAMANHNGVQINTKSFIDPTSWRDTLYPTTVHAYFYEEKLFAWTVDGGYIIDWFNNKFTTLDVKVDAAHRAKGSGKLYFIKANEDTGQPGQDHAIYEWESDGDDFFQYTWKSGKIILPFRTNMTAARIIRSAAELSTIEDTITDNNAVVAANAVAFADGDISDTINDDVINADEIHGDDLETVLDLDIDSDITFKLYGDGSLVHTETVQDDQPFRVTSADLYKKLEIQVSGYVPIQEIVVAPSMDELED